MRELLVRGKNKIDPEVIDPGGRSVEEKSDFTCTLHLSDKVYLKSNKKLLQNKPKYIFVEMEYIGIHLNNYWLHFLIHT
jgi:hypothetical protein